MKNIFEKLATCLNGQSYVGRGMREPCLAFQCYNVCTFVYTALEIIQNDPNYLQENLRDFSHAIKYALTDSLGLDMIIYFPQIQFSQKDEEDEEDDDDDDE